MIRACASFLLGLSIILVPADTAVKALQETPIASQRERSGYVGDEACASCHKKESLTYTHTSHALTSRLASKDSVLGSFREGSNELIITKAEPSSSEPALYFKMQEKNGSYYETAFTGLAPDLQSRTERIDIVTGSGVRGATYLYWDADRLFELPVSYWTAGHQWINSPGYENGSANFSRPINPGCLECHATYIHAASDDPNTNRYDPQSLITGINCERCHGPGEKHVALQRTAGSKSAEQAILNPRHFDRDRQVDLCALCHNGIQREATAPAFSYLPGKALTDYFRPLPTPPSDHPDVHGDQVGLLKRSRCYQSSPNMTCSTCHDVHVLEQTAATYSSHCLTCHQWQACGMAKKLGISITKNCIDCHMPVQPTNVIVSETGDKTIQAKMRNHWIKVYPEMASNSTKRTEKPHPSPGNPTK
jgi:hypothetical protein